MGPKAKRSEKLEEEIFDIKEELSNYKKKFKEIENYVKRKIEEIEEKCEEKIEENKKMIEEKHRQDMSKIEHKFEQKIQELEIRHTNIMQNYRKDNNETASTINMSHSTEITRPTFFGNSRDVHPIDFLNRLEEYFAIKQIYVGEKILVIGDCLKAAALNWFSTIRFQLSNYEDFKKAFTDEYWSREIQIQVWSQCLSINQVPQNENYRDHFAAWATRLRHLQVPKLSENEIVKNIAKHYPGYIRAILVSLPESTILAAMKVLGEEEHRKPQRENNTNYYNSNNQRTQHNSWNNRNQQRENEGNNARYNERNRQQINQVSIERTENTHQETTREDGPTTHMVNNIVANNVSVSPYIQCEIEGESIQLLVDTGATVSVLTKEIVEKILKKNNKTPVLPVSNVQISNAIGKKICRISKQIFCRCRIGSSDIYANFIQIENLNEKGIIGADVLNQYNAEINFNNQTIKWEVDQKRYTTPFANVTPRNEQVQKIQVINNDEETEQNIDKEQSRKFAELLHKYRHIFSNNPGKVRKYQCQIRVTEGDPI